MKDLHLVMDLDKLAKLYQELDYHSLQYIVDTDDYNDKNGRCQLNNDHFVSFVILHKFRGYKL